MVGKINRTKGKEEIDEFFLNLKDKTPEQVKKIKKLAMNHNIKLGAKRKLFCNACYSILSPLGIEVKIKGGEKIVKCRVCGQIARWKIY
ncbi:MAG: hypothetical protein AABX65_01245 [Nanoarchaeota archaeon]